VTVPVPTLAEVLAVADNGLGVASMFAGCGGSSLGYRAAGFRLLYANDMDRRARAAYQLNLSPAEGALTGTKLTAKSSPRIAADVRTALERAGKDELDVLDGSPPCQPFSTAGAGRGSRDGRDGFPSYVELVRELRPRAFVCENVPGLATARHSAYLGRVLAGLAGAGYAVQAAKLDAAWLGIPQSRKRVVIVGFRDDLRLDPKTGVPTYGAREASIADALPGVETLMPYADKETPSDRPAPTVLCSGFYGTPAERVEVEDADGGRRPIEIDEVRMLCGFPDGYRFPHDLSFGQRWKLLGNAVPPAMARAWAERVRDALLSLDGREAEETGEAA
jgi:DNA (cytosine-5)-methyltransferase 1